MIQFREATLSDMFDLHEIRLSVLEKQVNAPSLSSYNDYEEILSHTGRGWVCEFGNEVAAFGIADTKNGQICALYVHPDYEGMGIGKSLHDKMVRACFVEGRENISLSGNFSPRSHNFFNRSGWQKVESAADGSVRFVLTRKEWNSGFIPVKTVQQYRQIA